MPAAQEIRRHFQGRAPAVLGIYRALLAAARKLGPVREDPKQHLQIRLTTPKQVDRQLKGWLRRAYDLAG